MLTVMMCGANDTADVAPGFVQVTKEFGGEPWHYRTGEILYLNDATASWERNSRRSVAAADVCVFVILREYGKLTWSAELATALDEGKPFILLCLDSTYADYTAVSRAVPLAAVDDPTKRRVWEAIRELEAERQLTVVPFGYQTFSDVYRREMSKLFAGALGALSERAHRQSVSRILDEPDKMTRRDLTAAEAMALDEMEDKKIRKSAILALRARGGLSAEAVLALVDSREQGVQRLAIEHLPELCPARPLPVGFMEDCVAVANHSDDPGVARRLIPALFRLGISEAVQALETLDLTEIGARRRLATALEEHEVEIRSLGLIEPAVALLVKCAAKSEDVGWLARCRAYMTRLKSVAVGEGPDHDQEQGHGAE
ncbi:MAG: hypothetical protein Q4G45_05735 [Actinomycetia bacterium]|nr:hypothetical protein [Actinomycetes bacterium]